MSMSVGPAEGDEEAPMSEINTTPLVDVMLVMLIIFLITVPVVLQEAAEITLPKVAYQVTMTKPENVSLTVLAGPKGECQVYWNMERVTAPELLRRADEKLRDLVEKVGGADKVTEETMPEAHIRGDVNTPFRCIGGTMFTMQRAGFQRIGFISEPDPSELGPPQRL